MAYIESNKTLNDSLKCSVIKPRVAGPFIYVASSRLSEIQFLSMGLLLFVVSIYMQASSLARLIQFQLALL